MLISTKKQKLNTATRAEKNHINEWLEKQKVNSKRKKGDGAFERLLKKTGLLLDEELRIILSQKTLEDFASMGVSPKRYRKELIALAEVFGFYIMGKRKIDEMERQDLNMLKYQINHFLEVPYVLNFSGFSPTLYAYHSAFLNYFVAHVVDWGGVYDNVVYHYDCRTHTSKSSTFTKKYRIG